MKKLIFLSIFIPSILFSQWIQQQVPLSIDEIVTIDFANLNIGAAGGRFDMAYGRVIYTTNSGANWLMAQVPDTLYSVIKLQLIDISTGYVTGAYYPFPENRISYGTGRKVQNTSFFEPHFKKITGMSAIYKGIFLKTTNGGRTWFTYGSLPSNVFFLLGMRFVNMNTGFVTASLDTNSGRKYSILKTSNGGLSWNTLYTIDSVDINSVFTLDGNTIFATGWKRFGGNPPQGIILRSSNGGSSWNIQAFPGNGIFNDVNFPNSTTGFAVTYDTSLTGLIYKTTNSGLNWTKLGFQNPMSVYYSVEFINGTGRGIAIGNRIAPLPGFSHLLISKTTNYGSSWTDYLIADTVNTLNSSSMVDANNWFICGGSFASRIIYKTTNGGEPIGIKPISSEIPDRFSLNQNYPNPFNPATIINYELPITNYVRLSVYDVLGKEIAVLVNEKQQAGKYQVNWDASAYPSGVYFYRLTVSGAATQYYSETKKMVLVK